MELNVDGFWDFGHNTDIVGLYVVEIRGAVVRFSIGEEGMPVQIGGQSQYGEKVIATFIREEGWTAYKRFNMYPDIPNFLMFPPGNWRVVYALSEADTVGIPVITEY